jgi:hypothetical protein
MTAHPGPTDVLLVIEVADTSLAYDLGTKVPLYARHGIPEVWVIDAATRQTRVFRQPVGRGEASRSAGSGYATEVGIGPLEAVSCAGVVDDAGAPVVVELARLLPGSAVRGVPPARIGEELSRLARLPGDGVFTIARWQPATSTVSITVGTHERVAIGVFHRVTAALAAERREVLAADVPLVRPWPTQLVIVVRAMRRNCVPLAVCTWPR